MSCTYRIILSIDGGGVRGVIPLKILDYLHTHSPSKGSCSLTTCTDVFAATSASTIFAGALMLKDIYGRIIYSPHDILALYKLRGEQLFNRTGNESFPLQYVLDTFFKNYTMNDLEKHFFFISYNQVTEKPFFFTDSMLHYRDLSLSKVMQACSAYPAVFPALKLGDMELIDGSLVTKNPARMAYHHARLLYPNDPIVLVSIGVGEVPLSKQDFFEKDAIHVDQELKELDKKDRNLVYFRIQPKIDYAPNEVFENIDSSIDKLITITEEYILENKSKLNEIQAFVASKFD